MHTFQWTFGESKTHQIAFTVGHVLIDNRLDYECLISTAQC
jgi:hypothetical protein